MDLSQQELPLTAYFTRGRNETGPRAATKKANKRAKDLEIVSSKRGRSPSGDFAGPSKSRKGTLQLPTPATSTRKRMRSGRLEAPAKAPLTSADAPIVLSDEDLAELDFGPTPSKPPQSSRLDAQDAVSGFSSIPLATPSTHQGRITKSIGREPRLGSRRLNDEGAGIATPQTLPRRVSELAQSIDNHSTRPVWHSSSEPSTVSLRSPDPEVSLTVHSPKHSGRSTAGLPCFPENSDGEDPFCTRGKSGGVAQRDDASAKTSKRSKTFDGQISEGPATPMLPVPSSQSQYLLHLDATPKRKRYPQQTVVSSQTQEERELTLSTPHKLTASSAGVSPGKYTHENTRASYSKRQTLGPTSVISPNTSPSRSFFAMKKALDKSSPKRSTPSRRERLISNHSPETLRTSRCDSIENIPPVYIDDSLTESESESDILHLMAKAKFSAPICRGSAESELPGVEDDSATEAESDTEILHCVAAIGRKRPRDDRCEVSREDTPRRPLISPLVSPARPRIAPMPSMIGPTQLLAKKGSGVPHSSSIQRPQTPSESLPSVVRDFIHMFPGDESYPVDFPESLRI